MSGHSVSRRRTVHDFRRLEPPLQMWDEYGPSYFTLSYTKFLYSPDVFLDEFVIIYYAWAHCSEEKQDESFYRR
jgi:hypothetical protein